MRVMLAVFEDYASARRAAEGLRAAPVAPISAALDRPCGKARRLSPLADGRNDRPVRLVVEVRTEQQATQVRYALQRCHPLSVVEGFAVQNPARSGGSRPYF